jgi:hypothetical protein
MEDPDDVEAVKRAQARIVRYRAIRENVKTDTAQQQRLQELMQQAEQVREQLERLQAEVAERETRKKIVEEQMEKQPVLEAEAERLQELIEEAEPKLEELQQQLEELRTVLATRVEAGQSEVRILPSGTGYDLTPTFVECTADAVVLHDRPEPLRIPVGRLSSSEDFSRLLETVGDQPNGTVVFLVRPDGIGTYQTASGIARRAYVRNGKLAVAGHGRIDLSRFDKQQ